MGSQNSKPDDDSCPVHDLSEKAPSPLFGSTSFFEFNKILSGSCAAFATAVILIHVIRYATHLSNPSEQVKIMRISLLIPTYALISFLSICFPTARVYLIPWLEVFQAQALASFFLLMCEYVSPSHEQRDIFFAALTVKDKKAPGGRRNAYTWYRQRWIMIFQYPIVSLACAVATDITEAADVYCEYKTSAHYAKLWISIARYTSTSLAIISVFMMAFLLKPYLKEQRPLSKLLAFKLIVSLAFLQQIIYWVLEATHTLEPTPTLSYSDTHMGVPSMLSCLEMALISLLFVRAYPLTPYIIQRDPEAADAGPDLGFAPSYQGGPGGVHAYLAAASPRESFEGLTFAIRMAREDMRRKKEVGLSDYNPLVQVESAAGRR